MRLMMTLWAMQMTYIDGLHLVSAGPQKFLIILVAVTKPLELRLLSQVQRWTQDRFIEYHESYDCWAAGLSEKRCSWVIDWTNKAESNGWMVLGRHFIELAGRLTFVGLRWVKLFSSPLHSWAAVLARGTVARMSVLVHIALVYIRKQLQKGRRLLQPALSARAEPKCEVRGGLCGS